MIGTIIQIVTPYSLEDILHSKTTLLDSNCVRRARFLQSQCDIANITFLSIQDNCPLKHRTQRK